jgi:hypothetical protein
LILWKSAKQGNNIRQEWQLLATENLLKNNDLGFKRRHCGRNLYGKINRAQRSQLGFVKSRPCGKIIWEMRKLKQKKS